MQRKQFFIYGQVQGVGFRFATWRAAQKMGVLGFVRNRQDGSVEVVAEGNSHQLATLRTWLEVGPKTAKVEQIIEQEFQLKIPLSAFSIKF